MSENAIGAKLAATQADLPTCREQQFNEVIAVYLPDLYRYGYWLTGDEGVADDLVQETMVRAWKSFHKIHNPAAIKGWLITILRRENARRFERFQPQRSGTPVEDLVAKKNECDTSIEAFVLRQALQKLEQKYREPLLLQVIHGYSLNEIAEQLSVSPACAGTRLFRARQKLCELL